MTATASVFASGIAFGRETATAAVAHPTTAARETATAMVALAELDDQVRTSSDRTVQWRCINGIAHTGRDAVRRLVNFARDGNTEAMALIPIILKEAR